MRASKRGALALTLVAALAFASCPAREGATKGGGQGAGSAEGALETKGPDPRAAFESSGLLGGIAASPESPVALIAASGLPEAGVSLALGGGLSTAAIARRLDPRSASERQGYELVLASGARASLPGPILALASAGERVIAACADALAPGRGSLRGLLAEREGERLTEAWKSEGPPASRLLAVPGGRIAVADEAGWLRLLDASTGAQLWSHSLAAGAADIAYAPGIIVAAAGSMLDAFDESSGTAVWSAALTARARSISAGNGVALVLADSGSLSVFSLADGKGIGASPGPFDPSIRPIADGSRAIVALVGGGASEIETKSGQVLRSWAWEGVTSFIAADKDTLYAGIDGRTGRGILLNSRAGDAASSLAELGSPAFDSPQAVPGARGGLLLLLIDGSLVLVGKDRDRGSAISALDAAISAPPDAAAALETALGRFKPGDLAEPKRYLRFDLFSQGMPVDTEVAFTAFRYDCLASGKRSFGAKPGAAGTVVAIYDDAGREIAASIDEVGSSSSAGAYMEKGKRYWVVAGWTFQATPTRFRLYTK